MTEPHLSGALSRGRGITELLLFEKEEKAKNASSAMEFKEGGPVINRRGGGDHNGGEWLERKSIFVDQLASTGKQQKEKS